MSYVLIHTWVLDSSESNILKLAEEISTAPEFLGPTKLLFKFPRKAVVHTARYVNILDDFEIWSTHGGKYLNC
jgi:hypothetical protein